MSAEVVPVEALMAARARKQAFQARTQVSRAKGMTSRARRMRNEAEMRCGPMKEPSAPSDTTRKVPPDDAA
jgi:hypothetical protein